MLIIPVGKSFHKSLVSTLALAASLALVPLSTSATSVATAPPHQSPWCPPVPQLPAQDLPATVTKVDVLDESCSVYVLEHLEGSQTLVICVQADGSRRVTVTPLGGK